MALGSSGRRRGGHGGTVCDTRRHLTKTSDGDGAKMTLKEKMSKSFPKLPKKIHPETQEGLKKRDKEKQITSGSVKANLLNKPKDQKSNVLKATIRELT